MSLQGSYGPRKEPYVKGWLTIPRLGFLSSQITFLVDTGADHTTLMPADAVYAGLDYSALSGSVTTLGIGGLAQLFSERGIVIFEDSGVGLQCYEIDLRIAAIEEIDLSGILLGNEQDVRCRTHPRGCRLSAPGQESR